MDHSSLCRSPESGDVSAVFKISKVTPIFKSGCMSGLGNHRPITVISSFSKVLERLVYNQLMSFLEKECLLFNFESGFRKGYSTEYRNPGESKNSY